MGGNVDRLCFSHAVHARHTQGLYTATPLNRYSIEHGNMISLNKTQMFTKRYLNCFSNTFKNVPGYLLNYEGIVEA
jgi:hypothetical protein